MDRLTRESFVGPRAFARWMLRDERLPLRPEGASLIRCDEAAVELILFRDSVWQAALVILQPNVDGRPHRHNRVDSVDVVIAGGGVVNVLPTVHRRNVVPATPGELVRQLQRVPKGAVHAGQVGSEGAAFLSFQRWDDEPDFVANDWEWA